MRADTKKKREWRFIYTGKNDAFFNMALDEALLILCEKEKTPPILRLYQWEPKAVSVGFSQTIEKTVDLEKCREKNVDLVRRMTGGRAVLHHGDLTYSICASRKHFHVLGETVAETYGRISLAFLSSLKFLKIKGEWEVESSSQGSLKPFGFSKPCFSSSTRFEIKVNGRKLIGSAQRRFKNSFIQHGSIPLEDQSLGLADLLPVVSPERKKKVKRSLRKRSTSLRSLLRKNPRIDETISAVRSGFGGFFSVNLEEGEITPDELELAERLICKYRSENWNFRR